MAMYIGYKFVAVEEDKDVGNLTIKNFLSGLFPASETTLVIKPFDREWDNKFLDLKEELMEVELVSGLLLGNDRIFAEVNSSETEEGQHELTIKEESLRIVNSAGDNVTSKYNAANYEINIEPGQVYKIDKNHPYAYTLNIKNPNVNETEGSKWLASVIKEIKKPFTIIYEDYHVDREYRDSYYMFFSSQHFESSRFCKRLAFFDGEITPDAFLEFNIEQNNEKIEESYIGSCVVRPLYGKEIGKTLLAPDKYRKWEAPNCYLRLGKYRTTILGRQLHVRAFPFSMQDAATTVCADIVILNLLDYFSNKYADYHYALPSRNVEILQERGDERVLPARSMPFYKIGTILSSYGLYPRHYYLKTFTPSDIKHLIYCYVESGIPIAVGLVPDSSHRETEGHEVICIGHTDKDWEKEYKKRRRNAKNKLKKRDSQIEYLDSSDFHSEFVIMDDSSKPYLPVTLKEEKRDRLPKDRTVLVLRDGIDDLKPKPMIVNNITVPLYRRMYMDAMDARMIFDSMLEKPFGEFFAKKEDKNKKDNINIIIKRIFLASGRNYKMEKISNLEPNGENENYRKYKETIRSIPLPHFIWVCELYDGINYDKDPSVIGELILDATSTMKASFASLIMFRFENEFVYRFPDAPIEDLANRIQARRTDRSAPEKQKPYTHNLSNVNQKKSDT